MNEFSGKKINLSMNSSVKTLSMKFYEEQLPRGWKDCKEKIKGIDKKYHVIAIEHNRDYNKDDIWEPSAEKVHYHVLFRVTDKKPLHVTTILNMLGVEYRKDIDDNLFRNHGVETIKDFSGMVTYLTHETEQAQLDGKTVYELDELVSNLDIEEIKKLERDIFA